MNQNTCTRGEPARQHNSCNSNQFLLARRLITNAASRRTMPKMHWRWRKRGRDIVALFHARFGSTLSEDDAGRDALKLLAEHYMRLKIDAERVTTGNLRLWAPWLGGKELVGIIEAAKTATKPPSAVTLGRDWRVTVDEVTTLKLETVTAYSLTLERDRSRQARRRRKNGAGAKRGRPKSKGLKPWQIAGASSKAAYYRALKKKAEVGETENSHAPFYIRRLERDEFQSHGAEGAKPDGATHRPAFEGEIILVPGRSALAARPPIISRIVVLNGEVLPPEHGGCAMAPPPPMTPLQRAICDARILASRGL